MGLFYLIFGLCFVVAAGFSAFPPTKSAHTVNIDGPSTPNKRPKNWHYGTAEREALITAALKEQQRLRPKIIIAGNLGIGTLNPKVWIEINTSSEKIKIYCEKFDPSYDPELPGPKMCIKVGEIIREKKN